MRTSTGAFARLLASFSAVVVWVTIVHAQLVFVPDVNLRTWYNELIPGVVDGSGYLNTAHAMWDLWGEEELALNLTWQPCDLTSLESLPQLRHLEIGFGEQEPTFPAWPPNLETLVIHDYLGTNLPALPPSIVGLCLREIGSSLPVDLHEGLLTLQVQTSAVTTLDPMPSSLKGLLLRGIPLLSMPSLPSTLEVLICEGLPVATIEYPPSLAVLTLSWLPQLTSPLPALDLSYTSDAWPWPDIGGGGEESIQQGLSIVDCPLLPEPTQPISAVGISIGQMPWNDLPMITSTNGLEVQDTPLTGTLVLPSDLHNLYLTNVPITSIDFAGPVIYNLTLYNVDITSFDFDNSELMYVDIRSCQNLVSVPVPLNEDGASVRFEDLPMLISIPPILVGHDELADTGLVCLNVQLASLPLIDSLYINWDTAESLDCSGNCSIHDMMGLVWIQSLPDDNSSVNISNCPALACLPHLPDQIGGIGTTNTSITCYPNYPAWVVQQGLQGSMPPLCNVLNTTCNLLNPLIAGSVFDDQNADGVQDGAEPLKPNVMIECEPGGYFGNSGTAGLYEVAAAVGSFTVTAIPPLYHEVTTPAQPSTLVSITDLDTLDAFGMHTIPNITDLDVDLTSAAPPVPGFDRIWTLTVSNIGTTAADAEVKLAVDPTWSWIGASPAPLQWANDTARWTLSAMAPGTTWTAQVTLNLPAATPLGGLLTSALLATPTAQDTTPVDNWQLLEEEVVGSFDPNDKTVSPGSLTAQELQEGVELEYAIRFQNTGTWPASRVVVTDTLSSNLQWNTMRLISSSHPCEWYITAGVLHFVFDPINLPDSTNNEPESHGFVKFGMAPRTDLLAGAGIENVANIVFDFNAPVITEPAVFEVALPESIEETNANPFTIQPNPSSDQIILTLRGAIGTTALEIIDESGRVVMSTRMNGYRAVLDIATLRSGVYCIRALGGERMSGQRFIKY